MNDIQWGTLRHWIDGLARKANTGAKRKIFEVWDSEWVRENESQQVEGRMEEMKA